MVWIVSFIITSSLTWTDYHQEIKRIVLIRGVDDCLSAGKRMNMKMKTVRKIIYIHNISIYCILQYTISQVRCILIIAESCPLRCIYMSLFRHVAKKWSQFYNTSLFKISSFSYFTHLRLSRFSLALLLSTSTCYSKLYSINITCKYTVLFLFF